MQVNSTGYIIVGVFLTTWVQVLVSMCVGTLAVLAPPLMERLELEAHIIGVVIAILYLVAAVVGAISGTHIARHGAIRASQFCMAMTFIGLAIIAISSNFWLLLLGVFVLGFAFGPATPASSHLLSTAASPRYYNLIFSVKQTGVPIGNALAGLLMPGLSLMAGIPIALSTQAVAALVTCLLLEFFRRDYDRDLVEEAGPGGLAQLVDPIVSILKLRGLRLLMVTSTSFSFIQIASTTFIVAYLHEELGFDLITAGIMLTFMQVAGAVGRVLWGVLADITRRANLVLGVLAVLMTVSTMALAAFTSSWPLALIALVSMTQGGTAISWNGIYIAEAARLAPEGRVGAVTGGISFFTFMAVMAAPLMFSGLVSLTHSYGIAFAALGLCTLASAVALLLREFARGRT